MRAASHQRSVNATAQIKTRSLTINNLVNKLIKWFSVRNSFTSAFIAADYQGPDIKWWHLIANSQKSEAPTGLSGVQ